MITKSRKFSLNLIASLLLLLPAIAAAADAPPPLSEEWEFTIKEGQMQPFLAAVKEHVAVRREHNDPYEWNVYVARLGNDMNKVAIRHCCINWSDVDSYEKWSSDNPEVNQHWFETAAPHVEETYHFFEENDWANSHWNEEAGPYRLFGVTEFKLKTGHSEDFDQARDKMSQIAINQGWTDNNRSWLWAQSIGGAPREFLVVPYKKWADLAGGDQSFFEFLTEHMGSEQAAGDLLKQFETSTRGSSFQVWEHLPSITAE